MLTETRRRVNGRGMSAIIPTASIASFGPGPGFDRSRGIRGLGDDYDIAAQLNMMLMSFIASIPSQVEHGNPTSPSDVRSIMISNANNLCNLAIPGQSTVRCTVPIMLIDQLVDQYAQALASKQADFAAQVSAGLVSVPGGSTYQLPVSQSVPPLPPPPSVYYPTTQQAAPTPVISTMPVTSSRTPPSVSSVVPQITQYTADQNALNRSAPAGSTLHMVDPINVLSPPTNHPVVTAANVNQTIQPGPSMAQIGAGDVGQGQGQGQSTVTDQKWVFLAAAGLALLLFMEK